MNCVLVAITVYLVVFFCKAKRKTGFRYSLKYNSKLKLKSVICQYLEGKWNLQKKSILRRLESRY